MRNSKLTLAEISFIISSGKFGDASRRDIESIEMIKVKNKLLDINSREDLVNKLKKDQFNWNSKDYKEVSRLIKKEL